MIQHNIGNKTLWKAGFFSFFALGMMGASQAAVITTSDSIPLTLTDWNQTLTIDKFDPGMGTLNSITFDLSGTVDSTGEAENEDPAQGATLTFNVDASIMVATQSSLTDLILNISASDSEDVDAFDGDLDFEGDSGVTGINLTETDSITGTSSSMASLMAYTGAGETLTLDVTAMGSTEVTGSGNLTSSFTTLAGADLLVTYDFTPTAVPAPSALLLLGGGLLGLPLIRRVRRQG